MLLVIAGIAVASGLAWVGYVIAASSRMTADKVTQYANATELTGLSGADRAEALHRLEDMINRLSPDERRKWRRDGAWTKWFHEMTDVEKSRFIDATMPSGFKQWLDAFDGLPADQRQAYIDQLVEHLKATHELMTDREPGQTNSTFGTNSPPELSAKLKRSAQTIGIKTFYMESSAETKAELAPFLEELQRESSREKTPL